MGEYRAVNRGTFNRESFTEGKKEKILKSEQLLESIRRELQRRDIKQRELHIKQKIVRRKNQKETLNRGKIQRRDNKQREK